MSVSYHTNVAFSAIDDRAKIRKEQDIKCILAMMAWAKAKNPFRKNLYIRVTLKSHLFYTPKNTTVLRIHRRTNEKIGRAHV